MFFIAFEMNMLRLKLEVADVNCLKRHNIISFKFSRFLVYKYAPILLFFATSYLPRRAMVRDCYFLSPFWSIAQVVTLLNFQICRNLMIQKSGRLLASMILAMDEWILSSRILRKVLSVSLRIKCMHLKVMIS